MPQPAPTLEGALLRLRIFYGAIFVAALMQIGAAERLARETSNAVHFLYKAFLLVSVLDLGIAFFYRQRKVAPSIERLRDQLDDTGAIQNLTAGSILSVVLAESVVLCGFALQFLGATRPQAAPFYFAGVFLMLLWWPKRP